MIAGAFLAAWTDATFNFVGYTAIIINDIFTALYLVLVKNIKGLKELTTVGEESALHEWQCFLDLQN